MYYPHYKTSIRYAFTLQCPNLDHQLSLSLLRDAIVHGDIHYFDVCKVSDSVTIAYNNVPGYFIVNHETQTMVKNSVVPVNGATYVPWDWEIIQPFLDHYSLTPTWIDCHFTWGWLDEETGTWTGAVGMVIICSLFYCFIENINVVFKIFI